VPGIFAAGDVASAWHPILGRRIRVEHWDNAKRQGTAVAAGLMGEPRPYARVPYFFSDQFDLSMEYTGFASEWDRVVLRRDRETAGFTAFWLAGGRLLAGMQANVDGSMQSISALVAARPWLDPDRLADAEIPLESLLPAAGAAEAAA
jgi:3-phenylpropionate/trans-cinnamate dioxygenase ferredoxin reductase subunit